MEKRGLEYLNEFSFKRSFNKYVISGDTEIHEAYVKGQEIGTIPFHRAKILIVGDHAAGKTTTCRRLQGKEFRNGEPSTVGIETDTVEAKVSKVNSKWREVKNTPIEDYESSAAWWAVSHVLKNSTNTKAQNQNENTDLTYMPIKKLVEDIWYQMLHTIPISVTFFFCGFTFGFGLVAWTYIISLMTIVDVHSAYRFGCGYTIAMTLIDSIGIHLWTDIYSIIIVCIYGFISLITGVLIGAGGRTGICLAFCIMVHPEQKLFTFDNVRQQLMVIYNQAFSKLIIWIFGSFAILLFKNFHVQLLSLSKKGCIFTMIIMAICFSLVVFFGMPYFVGIFTLLYIVVIVFFTSGGILLGRKCVAYGYVPQIYILKKSVGFIAGLLIATFCGWEFQRLGLKEEHDKYLSTTRIFLYIPIIAYVIYEAFAFMKVKNTKAIPLTYIRESFKANVRMESYLDVRLSLWDFAGQEMYYNTHHLFLPKQGVYLVLFNVVEAVTNPGKQIKRLQFWLQSIAMHAEIEEAVVFLVGTRRTKINRDALSYFDKLVKFHLYRRFSKLLAFHPSGSLCFFIENQLQIDNELHTLREVMYSEVNKFKFFKENFQLKYILFKEILNKFCLQNCLITKLQTITDEVNSKRNLLFGSSKSKLMSLKEVRDILKLFDKSGDIVYRECDELLRDYVICNPKLLIDILKILVNVPEPHQRNRIVADFWQMLQDTGIVDSRLLEHICEGQGIWRLYPCVIRFLVGTHLIFPLNVTNHVNQIGTFCLPCRLPKINVSQIWTSNDYSQDIYYFDFGEMLPEVIFLRLLAKCCDIFTWDEIYYNAARFRLTTNDSDVLFLINTQVISGNLNSYDRNLIKLSVENDNHAQSIKILQQLINCTAEISNRLFNPAYFREQYICGPECKTCSYLDGNALCLVNLIAYGNDVLTLGTHKPDQYHKVTLKTKRTLTCNRVTSHWV